MEKSGEAYFFNGEAGQEMTELVVKEKTAPRIEIDCRSKRRNAPKPGHEKRTTQHSVVEKALMTPTSGRRQ